MTCNQNQMIIYPQKKLHSINDGISNESIHSVVNISNDQIEKQLNLDSTEQENNGRIEDEGIT